MFVVIQAYQHQPVIATFDIGAYGQTVHQVVQPKAFPMEEWEECESEDKEAMALEALLMALADWESAVEKRDVENMWKEHGVQRQSLT